MTARAIINGLVETVSGATFHGGRVLIDGSRIAAVGDQSLSIPSDAQVFDVKGGTVIPGFVDAHIHIGSSPYSMPSDMADDNEMTNPVTPECRILDSLYPFDEALSLAVASGVTCGQCLPGSANVIGGTGAVIKLHGTVIDKMIRRAPSAMKAALGENPTRVYGTAGKTPSTRMGEAALMRQCFVDALNYRSRGNRAIKDGKTPSRIIAMEQMLMVLDHKIPLRVHCHQANDICNAIRIAEEFGVDFTIEHCTDGMLIADYLAEHHVHAAVGPLAIAKTKPEVRHRSWGTPLALYKAGVHFCMITDHPVTPLEHYNVVPCLAINAGLPRDAALKAVTLWGAEHIGLSDCIGSLEAGKDADLSVWNGDPLDIRSLCLKTFIDGELVWQRQ